MRTLYNKVLTILLVIGILGVAGCGKKETEPAQVYAPVLSALTEEQSYSYAVLEKGSLPVLLVTDSTYDFDGGIKASIWCDVYYAWDSEAQKLGKIASLGTAYPISIDGGSIYAGDGHSVQRYVLDTETKQLVCAEYVLEIFDADGNETYTYYNQKDGEQTGADASHLETMTREFGEAVPIDFKQRL